MFSFFRKIRQNLLMENKFGKYIKYAIGEILLVVIGILIALQINNWNESRKLQEEIDTYLSQKLVNLREDQIRLVELIDFRLVAADKSKKLIGLGLENADVFEIINTTKFIFVERRFTSTVERNESSITKYYWSKKEAVINKLEQEYMSLIELILFEENRLNTFSETIEMDLWRQGYLTENRQFYISITEDSKPSDFEDSIIPDLALSDDNGQKSLEGLLHRNEIGNPSIAMKLNELLTINKKLINVIEDYLN